MLDQSKLDYTRGTKRLLAANSPAANSLPMELVDNIQHRLELYIQKVTNY